MLSIVAIGCREITVAANVANDLANKEGYIIEQVAASDKVQLYTNGIPYAVLGERIQGGDQWRAYLIGAGGIAPCVAGGAINAPAYVKPQNGGQVVAAASTNPCIGTKRDPSDAAAAGDVIGVDLSFVTMP
ncbi:MAG TPA: hypothetical protein VHX90_07635 [Verrucomicrobiae bacterium]|jgi:hypothetical protein|nr:hypothetical protein [Verrucomicrobiae bacterium]